MSQLNNVILALAMMIAAWGWHRVAFATPGFLRIPERTSRLLLRVAGSALILWIITISLAAIPGGRTQVAKAGQIYVWRDREPEKFWRELLLQTLLVGSVGAVFVVMAKRPTRSNEKAR